MSYHTIQNGDIESAKSSEKEVLLYLKYAGSLK